MYILEIKQHIWQRKSDQIEASPGGSPNRNRQVERQVDSQVERQVDDLFGSKNRQVEKSGRKSGWKKPSSWP